jgi:uncharacterized membrane protein
MAVFDRVVSAILSLGRLVFVLAVIQLGLETLLCARFADSYSRQRFYNINGVVPVIPWLPSSLPWLIYAFGAALAVAGAAMLWNHTLRTGALAAGGLMSAGAILLNLPRYAERLGDIAIRTALFEPLAIAALAFLLPGRDAIPPWLERAGRYALALSLIVFGVNHFLALALFGTLIPAWIPWHIFWMAFFGAGFIAAGVSVGSNLLLGWSTALIGLMFAIWVFTLHIPLVAAKPDDPDGWSSLFIAAALWGGCWAQAGALSGRWRGTSESGYSRRARSGH